MCNGGTICGTPINSPNGVTIYSAGYQITIKSSTGRSFTQEVHKAYSIMDLKQMIYDREGIPPAQQRLTFGGQTLEDNQSVGNYNIQNGNTVNLIVSSGIGIFYVGDWGVRKTVTPIPNQGVSQCVDDANNCVNVGSSAFKVHQNYKGSKSTTVVGKTCQVWSSDFPHKSEDKIGDHNKCRNPNGDSLGPLCMTSDPEQQWAYCFKNCAAKNSCISKNESIEYDGQKSTTVDDIPCQKWSSDSPHESENKEVGDHSYCRNPDNDPLGPWCYTTEPEMEWDYCFTQCMKIFVQTSVNKKVAVDVEKGDTVKNLKQKIHDIVGTAPHLQYLHFNNEMLSDDDRPLAAYNIKHKSTIHVTRN